MRSELELSRDEALRRDCLEQALGTKDAEILQAAKDLAAKVSG